MKAAIYARTSQENQGESISNQIQYLTTYLDSKGISYDEPYIDECSATSYNRPAFILILSKCGLKYVSEYDIFTIDRTLPVIYKDIYVKHSSRFSRQMSVLSIYELLLKQHVTVHFVEENKTSKDINGTSEAFVFGIQSLLNAQMSKENSVKIKTGMRSAAARGRILVSGNGVYGFDYDVANNRLIPNNKEVEVVHKIFQLYLEGNGLKKICNYLNSNNIPTKRRGKWNSEGIRTLLTNRKYIGESIRNKMCRSRITHDTKVSIRDESEWVVVKYGDKLPDGSTFLAIPPILDLDTFNKVQQRMESRRSPKNGRMRGTSILGSKCKCGNCGWSYVINSWSAKGVTHYYYTCRNKKLNTKATCSNPNIQLDKLEELILNSDYVNSLILRNKLLKLNSISASIRNLTEQLEKYSHEDLQSLQEDVVKLEHKKSKLVDYMLQDIIQAEEYKLKMDELNLQLNSIKSNIEDIQSNNTTTKYEIQRLKELKYKVGKTPINTQYSVQQVADMINEITVYPNKLIVDITVNDINYCDEVVY